MNIFELANVKMSDKVKNNKLAVDNPLKVPNKIHEVIMKCAVSNPTWEFVSISYADYSDGHHAFEVYHKGECLGKIVKDYSRGSSAIGITNQRIKDKRSRGDTYTTVDVNKALLEIKRKFAPVSPDERVKKALSVATTVMDNLVSSKQYERRELNSKIVYATRGWAQGAGFKIFLDYLAEHNPTEYCVIMNTIKEQEVSDTEIKEMQDISDGVSNGTSVVLTRDKDKYIVKAKDGVAIFDDTNLPEMYKTSLGMLKLIDVKAFISSRGCRVDENTFVIKVEEKDES
jgi:hypothetical protein